MSTLKRCVGGILLIGGTSIGAGMLALPVLSSLGGFFPAIVIDIVCWFFMMSTGLLLLELCLCLDGEPNIMSMASTTLGFPGKVITWALYLFLFFSLTTAYIAGGGELFSDIFGIPHWLGIVAFVLVFAPAVYCGARAVDRINTWMMLGLGISYFFFVVIGFSYVDSTRLIYQNWSLSLLALPVVFTSFGFQGIVPTLCAYLRRDVKAIRWAIIIGSSLPFFVYFVWQWLTMGIIPFTGEFGLYQAFLEGSTVIKPLRHYIESPWLSLAGESFAFFALATSFVGVTLGLFDFLADGLRIKKTPRGKWLLLVFVFVVPTCFAIVDTTIFIKALQYGGGYGLALLLGFLPIVMVWVSRYRIKTVRTYQVSGGRLFLVILACFVLLEIGNQLVNEIRGEPIQMLPVLEEVNLSMTFDTRNDLCAFFFNAKKCSLTGNF